MGWFNESASAHTADQWLGQLAALKSCALEREQRAIKLMWSTCSDSPYFRMNEKEGVSALQGP
ncbi:MAG: hypothetical protein WDA33_01520, partial [Alcaligenes sp.]